MSEKLTWANHSKYLGVHIDPKHFEEKLKQAQEKISAIPFCLTDSWKSLTFASAVLNYWSCLHRTVTHNRIKECSKYNQARYGVGANVYVGEDDWYEIEGLDAIDVMYVCGKKSLEEWFNEKEKMDELKTVEVRIK